MNGPELKPGDRLGDLEFLERISPNKCEFKCSCGNIITRRICDVKQLTYKCCPTCYYRLRVQKLRTKQTKRLAKLRAEVFLKTGNLYTPEYDPLYFSEIEQQLEMSIVDWDARKRNINLKDLESTSMIPPSEYGDE